MSHSRHLASFVFWLLIVPLYLYYFVRRLAEALNIENADRSPCQTVRFSPFLVAEAKLV